MFAWFEKDEILFELSSVDPTVIALEIHPGALTDRLEGHR